jgi:hypothetical protein
VRFDWRWDGSKLATVIEVPIGVQLTLDTPVSIDGRTLVDVSESGVPVAQWRVVDGHGYLTQSSERVVGVDAVTTLESRSATTAVQTTIGSGRYHFEATFA